MKLLFDECLPRPLRRDFVEHGHEVRTVPEMGWASMKNGELLATAAAAGFQVFLTMDNNIPSQQNLTNYPVPIVAFRAKNNTVETLRPLVGEVLRALGEAKPGEFRRIGL